jgi:hypothetical protein
MDDLRAALGQPGCWTGWTPCHEGWTRWSVSTAWRCPAGSAGGSPWPGRCWPALPVLILDEPTEHLDDETAAALTRDLLAAAADRTVLLITHRTDDLAAVDEVITLTAGRYGVRPKTSC